MVNQFDVYWVDLNPTVGAEMQKIRPCVIVSPKELNDHLDTIIIVPITSAIHGYPYRVACRIMNRDGEMATDQIRTIDKRRLKNRIATLTSDEVTALQDVLRQMFCEQIIKYMCKYKDTNLGIKKLDFNVKRGAMAAYLTDGREIIVPVSMFPDIKQLTKKQREDYMIMDDQYFSFEALSKIYSVKDLLRLQLAVLTRGQSPCEIKAAEMVLEENKELAIEKWNEYFGGSVKNEDF